MGNPNSNMAEYKFCHKRALFYCMQHESGSYYNYIVKS